MKREKRSFLLGAAILSAAGIICRILGAVYRIPLSNILGTEGMGNYQMAYPVYSMLIMASSAGIPVAVSKLTAERLAKGDECGAYGVFRWATVSLGVIGTVCSLALFIFARPVARLTGLEGAAISLKIIAPSIVMVALTAGYRGYMQGRLMMGATAVSQLAEQLVRMSAGLLFAYLMINMGAAYGAGGAMAGVTLSEAAGLLVMIIYHRKSRPPAAVMARAKAGGREVLKSIYAIAMPVTVGACAVALISAVDSAVMIRILERKTGGQAQAAEAYGLLTGFVQPVVNMPAVLTGAVAVSIIPAIAAASGDGRERSLSRQSTLGFRAAMILSVPCAVALFVMAEPLMSLLYSSLKGDELRQSVYLLRMLSPSVVMMGAGQICSGILQGSGRPVLPVLSAALGALLKVFIGLWLMPIDSVNIAGAVIGTLVCFTVSGGINIALCRRYAAMKTDLVKCTVKPLAASGGMAVVMFIINGYLPGRAGTVAAVLAGVVVYAIILLAVGGISPEDTGALPGGKKIDVVLKKLRIWR